jgi:mannitol/fructose-specific phosphotransferase system IIA component (Ntr-type)
MIAPDIDPADWPGCIDRLVSSVPGVPPGDPSGLSKQILNAASEFSAELAAGITLVHLHSEALSRSALLVVTSRQGICLSPGSDGQRTTHLLLILLDNSKADIHIANLAALARMVADRELAEALMKTNDPASLRTLVARALCGTRA